MKVGVESFDNAATGSRVTTGGVVSTVNVTGELLPSGFLSELSWVARAGYVPSASAFASPDSHAPRVPIAVAVDTCTFAELKMWTTTDVLSLAVPVKDGVVSFDGVGGVFRVTTGEAVLTVNVTVELL